MPATRAEEAPATEPASKTPPAAGPAGRPVAATPGLVAQTVHLVARRWKIFFRDRTQLILHLSILFGFPALVMLFALNAAPPPKVLSGADTTGIQMMEEKLQVFLSQLKAGGFASGLVMFQVILLTLMGSNNSAREIAGERMIFEKEKLAGLRPSAYLLSKLIFLVVPVAAQAIWMGLFVQFFWPFPGGPAGFTDHLVSLLAVTAAMTSICLGISANMRSADQANLLSVYLVGFQLPLSGIVLALPALVEPLVRPFIAAYWSWSASVSSLGVEYLSAVKNVSETGIQGHLACLFILGLHLVLGIFATYIGTRRNFWE
jgi:ABC transport system ATP-binding/permease protein